GSGDLCRALVYAVSVLTFIGRTRGGNSMADMSVASNNERRLVVSDRAILDRDRIVDGLKQWGVVLVFVGLVICFSVLLPDTFLTTRNAINILNNSPALILFATGA